MSYFPEVQITDWCQLILSASNSLSKFSPGLFYNFLPFFFFSDLNPRESFLNEPPRNQLRLTRGGHSLSPRYVMVTCLTTGSDFGGRGGWGGGCRSGAGGSGGGGGFGEA